MEMVLKVRAVITGYHASNVNAFLKLHNMFDGDKKKSTILLMLIHQIHLYFLI